MLCRRFWRIRSRESSLNFFDTFVLAAGCSSDSLDSMKNEFYIPDSLRAASTHIRAAFSRPVANLPRTDFIRAWCSIAYLFPGLHPNAADDSDGGWPRALKPMAAEAWRRAEQGEISDDQLYPIDSQWSGLYDRMQDHAPEETERRQELAAAYGHSLDA